MHPVSYRSRSRDDSRRNRSDRFNSSWSSPSDLLEINANVLDISSAAQKLREDGDKHRFRSSNCSWRNRSTRSHSRSYPRGLTNSGRSRSPSRSHPRDGFNSHRS